MNSGTLFFLGMIFLVLVIYVVSFPIIGKNRAMFAHVRTVAANYSQALDEVSRAEEVYPTPETTELRKEIELVARGFLDRYEKVISGYRRSELIYLIFNIVWVVSSLAAIYTYITNQDLPTIVFGIGS